MSLNQWMKFVWPLTTLDTGSLTVDKPLVNRLAEEDEDAEVLEVLCKSAVQDMSLGEGGKELQQYFQRTASKIWRHKEKRSIVLLHGERIVAASVLIASDEVEFQLASGPCVLSEYRSRGLGSYLLRASLRELKEAGITEASGVCKQHSILAKYIYPKFGGKGTPFAFQTEKD